jgi:hypothetical protein
LAGAQSPGDTRTETLRRRRANVGRLGSCSVALFKKRRDFSLGKMLPAFRIAQIFPALLRMKYGLLPAQQRHRTIGSNVFHRHFSRTANPIPRGKRQRYYDYGPELNIMQLSRMLGTISVRARTKSWSHRRTEIHDAVNKATTHQISASFVNAARKLRLRFPTRVVPNTSARSSAKVPVNPLVTSSPRKSLGDLTCNPLRRRVGCDADPDEISAIKPDDDEAVQQLKANGRHHE